MRVGKLLCLRSTDAIAMRLAPLLALLLAAPALHAQTPDPTPAADYYPLAVGNQWEYRDYDPEPNSFRYPYERVTVTGQVMLAGREYFTVVTQRFRRYSQAWDVQRSEALLRFDADSAMVRRTSTGASNEQDLFACRLDLPVTPDGVFVPCGDGPLSAYSVLAPPAVPTGGPIPRYVRSVRFFYFTTQLAAGIGVVGVEGCEISCTDKRLEYARVDGVTYGQKIPDLPFEPDLTPAADYYPLEVGNEWIYHYTENSPSYVSDTYERRRVLREETVDGLLYAVDQTCTLNQRDAAPTWACGTERRVRLDPVTTDVVLRLAPGVSSVLFCRLGADFGAPLPEGCDGAAYIEAQTTVQIGSATYVVPSSKRLSTLANVAPAAFLAGIGPAERPVGAFQTGTFEFARVRGVEYGQRPVAGEIVPSRRRSARAHRRAEPDVRRAAPRARAARGPRPSASRRSTRSAAACGSGRPRSPPAPRRSPWTRRRGRRASTSSARRPGRRPRRPASCGCERLVGEANPTLTASSRACRGYPACPERRCVNRSAAASDTRRDPSTALADGSLRSG